MPLHSSVIIQDARPQIVGAPLTLISMMGQEACRLPCYIIRRPLLPLWMDVTMQLFDCWIGMTVNHSHFVNPHLRAHCRHRLTVIGCSTIVHKMRIIFIASEYTVSTYYHSHPKALTPLSFWASTIHIIRMMNVVGPSLVSDFGREFLAWKSIH